MKYWIILIAALIISSHSKAQQEVIVNKDTLRFLLSDLNVQIAATEGVNNMYNFKFDKAERQFRKLKQEYYWHPLPYFLLGLNVWWKISPNDLVETYDDAFHAHMDSVIHQAELLSRIPAYKAESNFFLAAAHAFKARLYSDRGHWRKAISSTTTSLRHLDVSKSTESYLNPELLFGDGIYNYYAEWIPENYPLLKPVMSFFQKGDKELGIKQLKEVANNAFYTRTEAQYFLIRILSYEEKRPLEATELAEYLHKTFPDNSFFHRYYARLLYSSGRYSETRLVSQDCLAKIDSGYTGYEGTTGRYCCFFLGQVEEAYHHQDTALYYYERAIQFSESINSYDAGYYHYSLLKAGRLRQDKGDKKEALELYKKARKHTKRSSSVNKKAREYMREF